MRICLIYDCLYPHTVGGAERWYRVLSERLAAEGHEVTYLTLRQWERGEDPGVAGVNVVPVGPRLDLYVEGRRRVAPPLIFGLGIFWHLLRRGRRYDVVHTASFPYFSLLAAGLLRPLHRFGLVVDWFEVWTLNYWRNYLGKVAGRLGWLVQRSCLRMRQRANCFSRLHARRLEDEGFRQPITVLEGAYTGEVGRPQVADAEPVIVFAGRHIPEKRVPALIPAFALAREVIPDLRLEIFGDGPEREEVLAQIAATELGDYVRAPGFVSGDEVDSALARALCMVLPSQREGYGLIVVEAASRGVPSVVVADPDNAATELISEGENGFIASSAAPEDLAAAIVQIQREGQGLREATADWFAANGERLSLASSLETVVARYGASVPVHAGNYRK